VLLVAGTNRGLVASTLYVLAGRRGSVPRHAPRLTGVSALGSCSLRRLRRPARRAPVWCSCMPRACAHARHHPIRGTEYLRRLCGSARAASVQYTLRGPRWNHILAGGRATSWARSLRSVKVKDRLRPATAVLPNGLALSGDEANRKGSPTRVERLLNHRPPEVSGGAPKSTRLCRRPNSPSSEVGDEGKLSSPSRRRFRASSRSWGQGRQAQDVSPTDRELGDYQVGIKIHPEVRPK